jgi:hypothetical protein
MSDALLSLECATHAPIAKNNTRKKEEEKTNPNKIKHEKPMPMSR